MQDARKYIKGPSDQVLSALYNDLPVVAHFIVAHDASRTFADISATPAEKKAAAEFVRTAHEAVVKSHGVEPGRDLIKAAMEGLNAQQYQDAMRALSAAGIDQTLLRSIAKEQGQTDMESIDNALKEGATDRMLEVLGKLKTVTTDIKEKGETPQRVSEQGQHYAELSKLVGGSVVEDIKGDPSKASPDGLKESFYKHYELWNELNGGELAKVRLVRAQQ